MSQLSFPSLTKQIKIAPKFDPEADACIITADVLEWCSSIQEPTFQLVVTSPPYNVGKDYEQRIDFDEYLDEQAEVIRELVRILKPRGSICWQVGNYVDKGEVFPLDAYFYRVFKKLGLKLRNRVVWHFGHGLHASNRFSGRYETLLWFTKGDDYLFNLDDVRIPAKYPGKRSYKGRNKGEPSGNPLGKNPSDVWHFLQNEWRDSFWEIPNVKSNHPEKTGHPCQFPVELVERCVLAFTYKDDWVLDPYGGVGSTAIAAVKNGRRCVSVDRDEDYNRIAAERLAQFSRGKLKLRPMGKPVHKPSGTEKVSKVPEEWKENGDSAYSN